MTNQEIIDQFFIQDGQLMPDGLKTKRSVLLALIEDMKYSVQLPGKWRELGHTPEQTAHMQTMLPSFTVVSLFCTGIDVLAKVTQKQITPPRQNRTFFTTCAYNYFGLSNEESIKLWELRNNILHAYKLAPNTILEQFGYGGVIRQFPSGQWHFYLHAMYSQLTKISRQIYEELSAENEEDKQNTVAYLESNGFFYSILGRSS